MEPLKVINYNKAVRDRIPEIIKESGKQCKTRTLSDEEYLPYLEVKLEEELREYTESRNLMELADLLEIIHRITEINGSSIEELEKLRLTKKQERGGFSENIVLETVTET